MGERKSVIESETETYQYSGSPVPFATFLVLTVVFLLLVAFAPLLDLVAFQGMFLFPLAVCILMIPASISSGRKLLC
jgi:hypothetical protein